MTMMNWLTPLLILLLGHVVTAEYDSECYLEGKNLRNADITSFTASPATAEECMDACSRHPLCAAFTFNTKNKKCYLKTEEYGEVADSKVTVSGRMDCFYPDPAPESEYENVARLDGVEVVQSGAKSGYGEWRARDGITITTVAAGGCSYTNDRYKNYWSITLPKVYSIDHIVLYGHSEDWDDDEGLLNGAYLLIGNSLCEVISGMEENPRDGHVFNCQGDASKRVGKVVTIENWYRRLVICEIEIMVRRELLEEEEELPTLAAGDSHGQEMGEFYNVAFRKPASQNGSVRSGAYAGKAVDGWTVQEWLGASGTCSHTNDKSFDNWRVDLGRVYKIDHILVWGVSSDTRAAYMEGAMLWVDGNLCQRLTNMKTSGDGGPEEVRCAENLMAGSQITISQTNQYVSLCEVQVMVKKTEIDEVPATVDWPGETVGDYTNVALNNRVVKEESTAKQSSTKSEYGPRRANDGDRNGNIGGKSVTHTFCSGLQYWTVDLGRVYRIDHITIFGRTDCCHERLEGARVIVAKNTMVADYIPAPTKAADPIEIDLSDQDVYGRNVRVELLNNCLSLAEVEVWVANSDLFAAEMPTQVPQLENVAYRKPTSQSSDHAGMTADRAVDNYPEKTDPENHRSCSHTLNEPVNWWEVDLGEEYYIDHIVVIGRGDSDNAERINMATLLLDDATVAGFEYIEPSRPFIFPLNGRKARHVKIVKIQNFLTLCEVQVFVDHGYQPAEEFVDPITMETPNLATTATVSASSSMFGAVAEHAADGTTDGDFFHGSCYFAGPHQDDNWLKFELSEPADVGKVYIYPRLDYYAQDGIDGAYVRAGTRTCGQIAYAPGTQVYEIDCGEGEVAGEVTVSKLGWLSVCEVVIHAEE